MKQYRLMHMLLLVAMLLAGVSCTNDLSEELQTSATPLDGLAIGFDTGSKFTRVDVPSESTLREDLVDHVDVFIFDGTTGTLVNGCYWHKTAAGMEENQTRTETLLDGEWKTSPLSGTDYDVYVVANLYSSSDLSEVQSVAGLQDIIERDADIYKVYNETDNPGKLFTMSGKVEGFNPQNVDDEYILPVTLKRVAAKIEIHLAFDPEFAEKYESTSVLQRLLNYGTSAYALEGQDDIYAAERASMDVEEEAYQYDASKNEATLVLYTYPTEWETDVMQETFVVVNVPVVNKDVQEGEDATYNSNYYKIPLRSVTDAKRLERNHLYRVNATINMLGNYTPDTPVELKKVEYAVQDWVTVPIIIDGDNPQYLVLSEEKITMRDISVYNKLKFASSSPIVSAKISDIYYIDKNGNRQTVRDNNISATPSPSTGLNGILTINSPVPTNKTIRYMTLTVQNAQGETRTVEIEQYPLEYITGIAGYHSYRKDFNSREYPQPCTYEYRGSRTVLWGSSSSYGNGGFQSKAYVDGRLGTFEWSQWGNNANFTYQRGWGQNNRMYHVVITATSNDYTLARPLMDTKQYTDGAGQTKEYAITAEGSENDNLVSPSFMLASQLGMVWEMSWEDAQKQCAMYVEKGMNGRIYDDWRLPTAAELRIIAIYQNTASDVMDKVLGGTQYWSSRTNYVVVTSGGEHKSDRGRNPIRCIRDFDPEDPIE